MKIAIVTLPLHTNYGGILQAYALKLYLEHLGHEVTVLDMKDKMPLPKWWKAPFVYARRWIRCLGSDACASDVFRELRFRREYPVISVNTRRFIDKYIAPRMIDSFEDVRDGDYDAFVVGSDQVWRPLYFRNIEDAFLAFTRGWNVRRVSYAASFGTDNLEYTSTQLETCASLLACFDSVSVREDTGVSICREWFDCDSAIQVLDPVMLMESECYGNLIKEEAERPCTGRMITYFLDGSSEKEALSDFIMNVSGLQRTDISPVAGRGDIPLQNRIVPSLESWLAAFADAGFVVTDSFHGCVLSLLFHKPFVAVGNFRRGMTRLQSLLEKFGLDMRLVHGIDPEDNLDWLLADPDWETVDEILQAERSKAKRFLVDSLD